eukprot:344942-Amphidinium_carterae.1
MTLHVNSALNSESSSCSTATFVFTPAMYHTDIAHPVICRLEQKTLFNNTRMHQIISQNIISSNIIMPTFAIVCCRGAGQGWSKCGLCFPSNGSGGLLPTLLYANPH